MQDAILLQFHCQLAVEASCARYVRCRSHLPYEVRYARVGFGLHLASNWLLKHTLRAVGLLCVGKRTVCIVGVIWLAFGFQVGLFGLARYTMNPMGVIWLAFGSQ